MKQREWENLSSNKHSKEQKRMYRGGFNCKTVKSTTHTKN